MFLFCKWKKFGVLVGVGNKGSLRCYLNSGWIEMVGIEIFDLGSSVDETLIA